MILALSLIGAGGLLGGGVWHSVSNRELLVEPVTELPWSEPEQTVMEITARHARLLSGHVTQWIVMWCAGAGSVGADPAVMATETRLVDLLASFVCETAEEKELPTVLSFASSAGAVWSGTKEPVLSEGSAPDPWHPYGRAKLEQEGILQDRIERSAWVRGRIARISNLYGPQLIGRPPSGLLGHLVANALQHRPTSIYVPMDTQRDYVFVDHAAEMMFRDAVRGFDLPAGQSEVDLVAAGRSHTIASAAATLERVLTRRVPLTVGYSALASRQPRILSFRSGKRDLQRLNPTGLDVGLRRLVSAHLVRSAQLVS